MKRPKKNNLSIENLLLTSMDGRVLVGRAGRCERNECSFKCLKAWLVKAASAARLLTLMNGRVLVGSASRAECLDA